MVSFIPWIYLKFKEKESTFLIIKAGPQPIPALRSYARQVLLIYLSLSMFCLSLSAIFPINFFFLSMQWQLHDRRRQISSEYQRQHAKHTNPSSKICILSLLIAKPTLTPTTIPYVFSDQMLSLFKIDRSILQIFDFYYH